MPFYVQDCFDASFLANLFRRGYDGQDGVFVNHSNKLLIALFDFDYEGYNAWNSLVKLGTLTENDPTKSLTKQNSEGNGYAILLPVPNNLTIKNQVIKNGIETYENESLMPIELLFYGVIELERYFAKEKTKGGGEVVTFVGKKRDFANKLSQLKTNDFNGLKSLFDKLDEIISTNAQQHLAKSGADVQI